MNPAPAHRMFPAQDASHEPGRIARASGSVTVLGLEDLARGLRHLHPPPAYRLSVDSGVEYKNVRRALERPLAARFATWQKLLRSLGLRMVAAASAEDVIWPGTRTVVIGFGDEAASLVDPSRTTSLRAYRMAHGWSRRGLARRAGVSAESVDSVERGHGLAGRLAQVCEPLGLRLLIALPAAHGSLDSLWHERQSILRKTARGRLPPTVFPLPTGEREGARGPR
jgi:DNA-binding XRE family transcriptional regulator